MAKNKLLQAMTSTPRTKLTENGAKTLDQSGSKLVDLFSKGASYRSRSDVDVIKLFDDAFDTDALLALKTLFYIRDVRGGQGERRFFRVVLKWLAKNHPDTFVRNFQNIADFGRFDDLFEAFDTPAEEQMVEFIKAQLGKDSKQKEDTELSLLAKWMPSINTSSKETRFLAHRFAKALRVTPAKYRKTLSKLRTRLNIVEKLMSEGDWTGINFEHVPSKANLLYRKAFSRQQPDRYTAFIKSVQKGDAKINASTIYPYEIVRDALGYASEAATLDALWKALPDYAAENPHNGIVVCDTSGSMTSNYGTTIVPIWVSVSLAIYFAQRTKGAFKDHFLTFNDDSKLIKIRSKDIVSVAREVQRAPWGGSTNLQSAFDNILKHATANRVEQSELPDTIYVISDMELNVACSGNNKTNFEVIKEKYRKAGYKMPRIVFWNVAARNDQSPVKFDESGTALVSGCSPSIFKTVLSGKNVTPYEVMMSTINADRYKSVVV